MKTILLSILAIVFYTNTVAQNLPNPVSNVQVLPKGSYVIAMDNTNQGNGKVMNIKAYGLVVALLNNEIKLKWVINSTKNKDGIDFSVNSNQVLPTVGQSANLSFKAGPFVIFKDDTAGVSSIVQRFNSEQSTLDKKAIAVRLFRTNDSVSVDIRYDMSGFKPKAAILNDGKNSDIHFRYMKAAGMPITNYNLEASGRNLVPNCYTFASEPHNDRSDSSLINSIRNFVSKGGNFLAQCEAIVAYENHPVGKFHTTFGVFDINYSASTISFPNPNLSYSQIEGDFSLAMGGSVQNWRLNSGSMLINNSHNHVQGTDNLGNIITSASVAKVGNSNSGGLFFYLGSHDYKYTDDIKEINGIRMYLNAAITPTFIPLFDNCLSTVPVYYISFDLKKINNKVRLSWKTSTEIDNYGFEVQRKLDNGTFKKIGFVSYQDAIVKNYSNEYVFYDVLNDFSGNVQYRLRQIDNSGKESFSEVRLINYNSKQISIKISPNPSQGNATIFIPNNIGRSQISLSHVSGKTIKTWIGVNIFQVSVSNLNSGLFILKIDNVETQSTLVEKLLIK